MFSRPPAIPTGRKWNSVQSLNDRPCIGAASSCTNTALHWFFFIWHHFIRWVNSTLSHLSFVGTTERKKERRTYRMRRKASPILYTISTLNDPPKHPITDENVKWVLFQRLTTHLYDCRLLDDRRKTHLPCLFLFLLTQGYFDEPDIWGLKTIRGTAGGRKSPLVRDTRARRESNVNTRCISTRTLFVKRIDRRLSFI